MQGIYLLLLPWVPGSIWRCLLFHCSTGSCLSAVWVLRYAKRTGSRTWVLAQPQEAAVRFAFGA